MGGSPRRQRSPEPSRRRRFNSAARTPGAGTPALARGDTVAPPPALTEPIGRPVPRERGRVGRTSRRVPGA